MVDRGVMAGHNQVTHHRRVASCQVNVNYAGKHSNLPLFLRPLTQSVPGPSASIGGGSGARDVVQMARSRKVAS